MMTNQVDSLDEQILAALQENGRLTMKSLAEQVGSPRPRHDRASAPARGTRRDLRLSGHRRAGRVGATHQRVDRGNRRAARPGGFNRQVQEQPAVAEVHRTTGDATHLVKVNVPDMATLEKIVDDLSETGARCQTTVVLSSPVPYRPITPPEGLTVQRSRLARRRRKSVSEDGANGEAPKRPGRPRGRRPAAA